MKKYFTKTFSLKFLLVSILIAFNFYNSNAGTFYWVGGSGYWSDYQHHWATSSGGATFQVHPPTLIDDVVFDLNSFITINDTVSIDTDPISCRNFDWSILTGSQTFTSVSTNFQIYGSFEINSDMNWFFSGTLKFLSTSQGNLIDMANQKLFKPSNYITNISIEDSGSWELINNIFIIDTSLNPLLTVQSGNFRISKGSLKTNGYSIFCFDFFATIYSTMTLDSSTIYCSHDFTNGVGGNIFGDSAKLFVKEQLFLFGTQPKIGYVDCNYCHVNCAIGDLECRSFLSGFNYQIDNCNILSGEKISDYGYIKKMNIVGNFIFSNSRQLTIDTLNFLSPGQTIDFKSDSILVNNKLAIASASNSFINFQNINGTTKLFVNGDTVCTDNLFIKNINSSGNAVLFAGDHGLDLGGNTGWNFSSCTPTTTNVWPGDANYDLITDNNDILAIAIAMGDSGISRSGASLNYTAQPCLDWSSQFGNGVNVKNADCDGNGIVEFADTVAVTLNYSLIHPIRPAPVENTSGLDPLLYFNYPPGPAIPGSLVDVPIMLGTEGAPVLGIYGLTFSVSYDQSMIEPGSFSISLDSSWLADTVTGMTFMKDISSSNKFDACLTRINHTDVDGNGRIGTLHFKLSQTSSGFLHLGIFNSFGINQGGLQVPIKSGNSGGLITSIDNLISLPSTSKIYPNPVTNQSQIFFLNPEHSKCDLIIFDTQSRILRTLKCKEDNSILEKNNLLPGVYFYKILSEKNLILGTGKIIIE